MERMRTRREEWKRGRIWVKIERLCEWERV